MSARERGSWGSLSLRTGSDVRVFCHRYPQSKPILDIAGSPVSLMVTGCDRSGPVTADELAFARGLVAAAGAYLAELERLHGPSTAPGADPGAA